MLRAFIIIRNYNNSIIISVLKQSISSPSLPLLFWFGWFVVCFCLFVYLYFGGFFFFFFSFFSFWLGGGGGGGDFFSSSVVGFLNLSCMQTYDFTSFFSFFFFFFKFHPVLFFFLFFFFFFYLVIHRSSSLVRL